MRKGIWVLWLVGCGAGTSDLVGDTGAEWRGHAEREERFYLDCAEVFGTEFSADPEEWPEWLTRLGGPADTSLPSSVADAAFGFVVDHEDPPVSMMVHIRLTSEYVDWITLGMGLDLEQPPEVYDQVIRLDTQGRVLGACHFNGACLEPECEWSNGVAADGVVTDSEVFGWMQEPAELIVRW